MGRTRARDGKSRRGVEPPREERLALARGFGHVLSYERVQVARLTQAELAERAGLSVVLVGYLEQGRRRPTTSTTWKLARALRARGGRVVFDDAVALDDRLRRAAGGFLVGAAERPHGKRERVRAELRERQGDDGPLVTEADTMGGLILADVGESTATYQHGAG